MSNGIDKQLFLDLVPEAQRKIVMTTPLLPAVACIHNFLDREAFVAAVAVRSNGRHHVLMTNKLGFSIVGLTYNPNTSSATVFVTQVADDHQLGIDLDNWASEAYGVPNVPNIKNIKRHVNSRTKMGTDLRSSLRRAKNRLNIIGENFMHGLYEKLMAGVKASGVQDVPHFEISSFGMQLQTVAAMKLMGDSTIDYSVVDQTVWAEFKKKYDNFMHDMQVYNNALKTAQKIFSYDKWLIGLREPVGNEDRRNCPFVVGRVPSGMMLNQFQPRAPYADFNWLGEQFNTLDLKLYSSVEDMRRDPEVYASVNASLATLRAGRNRAEDVFDTRGYRPSAPASGIVLWEHLDAMAYQVSYRSMIWIMVDAV